MMAGANSRKFSKGGQSVYDQHDAAPSPRARRCPRPGLRRGCPGPGVNPLGHHAQSLGASLLRPGVFDEMLGVLPLP
jgi:hypothetical protein